MVLPGNPPLQINILDKNIFTNLEKVIFFTGTKNRHIHEISKKTHNPQKLVPTYLNDSTVFGTFRTTFLSEIMKIWHLEFV